jgi:hypothetical protein
MACIQILQVVAGSLFLGGASAQLSASPTFPTIANISTKVYNISAATTTLTYSYSNEELAMLWNQVGSIAIGPITATVSPTPEPTSYPRPGSMHPQVLFLSFLQNTISHCLLCLGPNIRHISQLPRLTRQLHLGPSIKRLPS